MDQKEDDYDYYEMMKRREEVSTGHATETRFSVVFLFSYHERVIHI